MINYDVLLRDIIAQRIVGISSGKQTTDFVARYVEKFGQIDITDPKTVLTTEEAGIYNIKILDKNGNQSKVSFRLSNNNGLSFYGFSNELGQVTATFDEKTGEPNNVAIISEDITRGTVYTTATPAGYRTSYYTAAEIEFQKEGLSGGITPETIEMTKDQIDGDVYLAAYMTHEAEVKNRFSPRVK